MKIILILSSLLLFGCYHNSELKHESGIVVEKRYEPEFNAKGSGVVYTTDGHMTFTDNSIHKAEQFVVVFKCEHGVVFSINRNELYANLNIGDSVIICFNEVLNDDNEIQYFDFKGAIKK